MSSAEENVKKVKEFISHYIAIPEQKALSELTLKEFFLWRNVGATLSVLTCVQLLYILLTVYDYTVISLLGRFIQIQVLISAVYIVFTRLTNANTNRYCICNIRALL
jgi:hypothetical protein